MFSPNLIVGVSIMVIGVLLVMDRLGFASVMDLLSYWPIVLVLFGASVVVQSLRRRDPSQPAQPPVVSPGLVLLLVIIAMLATSFSRSTRTDASSGKGGMTVFGVMGSTNRAPTGPFRGANIGGVMGRSTLDLRQATIAPGEEAVVDVFAAMGKVVIRVPDGWTVDTSALPVMGAVEDQRWPRRAEVESEPGDNVNPESAGNVDPKAPADVEAATPPTTAPPATGPAPRLVLRGVVMMGKVEIQS
jgi:hypothetical protein